MDKEPETIEEFLNDLNIVLQNYGKNYLNMNQFSEIVKIASSLDALKRYGITTQNYKNKKEAYNNFRDKAFDTYGIELDITIPFANPSDLYRSIDDILIKANLDGEQRNIFYQETELRERSPKKRPPKKHIFADIIESSLPFEDQLQKWADEEEEYYWDSLSQEEQDEIYGITPYEREAQLITDAGKEKASKKRAQKKAFFKRLKYTPPTS